MYILLWIILATVLDGLVAFIGVFSIGLKEKFFQKLILLFVAFSAGALLAGAFFHMIPEALQKISAQNVAFFIMIGFLIFFVIERGLHWHHCHTQDCDVHKISTNPVSYLVLFGDGIHNFVDGIIISAGFIASVPLGIMTTIVIIAHEIHQELGNFAILVHGGFKKAKALLYNFFSQLTSVIGGVIGFFFVSRLEGAIPFILSFAAGGFIYIAASDLVPQLHKEPDIKKALASFVFFVLGIGAMVLFKIFLGD